MPAGIRKSGVRTLNFPEGRSYLSGEELWFNSVFPPFEVSFTADANSLTAVFPVFKLDGFRITSDTIAVVFPKFDVSFTVLPGRLATIDATFPAFVPSFTALSGGVADLPVLFPPFDVRFTAGRATTLNAIFPPFTVDFTATFLPPLTLSAVFPVFQFEGVIRTPPSAIAAAAYEVWLVNARTKEHSTYTNFDITSVTQDGQRVFVTMEDGLYELVGDDDSGTDIDAKIYWAPTDCGTSKQKRIDSVYVNQRRWLGDLRVIGTADEVQKRIYTEDMTTFPNNVHKKRVLFTRNLQGQFWQIGYENVDGSDFELTDIELIPIVLSRRLK